MASLLAVPRIKLGSQGLEVSAQGLGCMGMSTVFYGPLKPEADMIELIHYAVEKGVTFLDTSDVYGPHTNEILVGKAIKGIRDKVQLATKFGLHLEDKFKFSVRGDPAYVRAACEASLRRLDVDYIDLYYQHRVDPKVPIEVTPVFTRCRESLIPAAGFHTDWICDAPEASASEIRRAHSVHPITAVQLEWSLWSRDVEEDVVPTCRELGIGIVPYSPLGQGFFSGKVVAEELADDDFRKTVPKFYPENLERNKVFYDQLCALGATKKATPGQLALAWVQHQGQDVAPIPGTTKLKNFEENIGAVGIRLSEEELKELEDAVPIDAVAGDRRADMSMSWRFASTPPLSSWKEA